jgi:hypothetical protein
MHEILWGKRQKTPTFSNMKTVHNKKKNTVVPIHDTQALGGSGGVPPLILNLGTKWGWVVDLTPRPLYQRGKSSRSLPDRSWVGPKAGLDVLEKWWNFAFAEIRTLDHPASSIVTAMNYAIPAPRAHSRLLIPISTQARLKCLHMGRYYTLSRALKKDFLHCQFCTQLGNAKTIFFSLPSHSTLITVGQLFNTISGPLSSCKVAVWA